MAHADHLAGHVEAQVADDEVLLPQLVQVDALPAGQRVSRGQHHRHPVGEQRLPEQVGAWDRGFAQGKIDGAVIQAGPHLILGLEAAVQADVRVLPQEVKDHVLDKDKLGNGNVHHPPAPARPSP